MLVVEVVVVGNDVEMETEGLEVVAKIGAEVRLDAVVYGEQDSIEVSE